MPDSRREEATREELWEALRRDADGVRGLQQYFHQIKDYSDSAFAEATGGTDRAEAMALLAKLTQLIDDLEKLTAELRPDVD
jgi:hypothetical protein